MTDELHNDQHQTDDFRVREFFRAFVRGSDTLDATAIGACFADPFLSADAEGARPVPQAAFLAGLPRRAEMFAEAGLGRAELTGLTHQRLDPHYLLAGTSWEVPRLDGGEPVPLRSSYLLHDDGVRLRIVLYLNHEGVPAVRR